MATHTTKSSRPRRKKDRDQIISDHLDALRTYANKVILSEDPLSDDEVADKETRFRELIEIGDSLNLTESEIVGIMFKGMLQKQESKCGCPQCRARVNNQTK